MEGAGASPVRPVDKRIDMAGKPFGPTAVKAGGEGGIRTHGAVARTLVFKTSALNHSATSPVFSRNISLARAGKGQGAVHLGLPNGSAKRLQGRDEAGGRGRLQRLPPEE